MLVFFLESIQSGTSFYEDSTLDVQQAIFLTGSLYVVPTVLELSK